MGDFIGSVWWMIVSLGVLVTFHEFGHFWVARRCGVKVLRFSVGFGKPLWMRRDRHGTEFAIAAIPLGGYVKMLDEREGEVHPAEREQAFNRKTVWQRIAIVAAGPIANLLLCMVMLWAMFVIGKQDYSATVGRADGLAAAAGLVPGERIVRIDGRSVSSWSDASMQLTTAAMDRRDVQVLTAAEEGGNSEHTLRLSQLPAGFDERRVATLAGIGWQFMLQPPVVDKVVAGSAADGVLKPGDRIVAIDGQPIRSAGEVPAQLQALGTQGGTGMIEVAREDDRLALEIAPRKSPEGQWMLGVGFAATAAPAYDSRQQYGVFAAVPAAIRETGKMTADSLGMMKRMLTGQASVKNISGPVTIARAANASAERGVDWFLYFLGLLSLSLAIINLMPIPILDGGHLLYYLIELVKGSPISERAMIAGQYVGLAVLAGLMGLAFYNDILGLVPR
ncbi:RIP metalloprotease RseP [Xanthomonas campestris]|uniref:Zinc metalloprotease n=1 Tax=Xanthomonas campestris pv. papavericola TaxID=487881 RepID=A0AAJ3CEP7_XANCA|nr:RIP metalloprotease RseP [Xanthomonas campestris]MCC8487235.1 RIP metalloprotease RseP [Xanthomonas campestris]MCW2036542.1 regulator of sigma E protease [Xanthomonas campestris]MEA9559470.1 RIP metalloprotease RseP [Xanthomonas campestris]MEA9649172.1 RIP metalloprotease RseP [Xanthomonas campestris pv. raphani]MEA9721533.1 RIP metalloprotease RseP [Xanthomonas campestris]